MGNVTQGKGPIQPLQPNGPQNNAAPTTNTHLNKAEPSAPQTQAPSNPKGLGWDAETKFLPHGLELASDRHENRVNKSAAPSTPVQVEDELDAQDIEHIHSTLAQIERIKAKIDLEIDMANDPAELADLINASVARKRARRLAEQPLEQTLESKEELNDIKKNLDDIIKIIKDLKSKIAKNKLQKLLRQAEGEKHPNAEAIMALKNMIRLQDILEAFGGF